MVPQTPINRTIFWKILMSTFRCLYVDCFKILRFLAELSTKLQKNHFFDNLRTITQEGNMETELMTSFFSSTFSTVTFYDIHFCIWKWSKLILMWSPLGPFWSVKYLNLDQKLLIRTAHHIFQESRHPEITKIHIMFCPLRGAKKGISSWTNIPKYYFPVCQKWKHKN